MPRDAVSRTANVERTGRHKWVKIRVARNRIVRNIFGSGNYSTYILNNLFPFNETYHLYLLFKLFKKIKMPNKSNSYSIERVQQLQTNHNYITRFISSNNLIDNS